MDLIMVSYIVFKFNVYKVLYEEERMNYYEISFFSKVTFIIAIMISKYKHLKKERNTTLSVIFSSTLVCPVCAK